MKQALKLAPLALLAFTTVASANNCEPRETVVKRLTQTYQEAQQKIHLNEKTGILSELFANGEVGTWTIINSNAYGHSCIINAGENLFFTVSPTGLKI